MHQWASPLGKNCVIAYNALYVEFCILITMASYRHFVSFRQK